MVVCSHKISSTFSPQRKPIECIYLSLTSSYQDHQQKNRGRERERKGGPQNFRLQSPIMKTNFCFYDLQCVHVFPLKKFHENVQAFVKSTLNCLRLVWIHSNFIFNKLGAHNVLPHQTMKFYLDHNKASFTKNRQILRLY